MSVIKKYYKGIYSKIQAEVDLLNETFQHQGLKGSGNENVIKELLRKFIPKKFSVGSGALIDRNGKQSKQCDIVIYDNYNYPEIFNHGDNNLFPVDLVYAVIEVKTTIDKTKSEEAIANIKSVKELDFIDDRFRINSYDPLDDVKADPTLWTSVSTSPPLGIVFGYKSTPVNYKTFANWFNKADDNSIKYYPSHVFCLDQGFLLTQTPDGFLPIVCPIINDTLYSTSDGMDLMSRNGNKWEKFEGTYYPVSKINGEYILIDQSKVLINFAFIITQLLQDKHLSPKLDIRKHYLGNDLLTMLTFDDNKILRFE